MEVRKIPLQHFGHPATVTAIPEVLDRLRQRGLRPVTMTELDRTSDLFGVNQDAA